VQALSAIADDCELVVAGRPVPLNQPGIGPAARADARQRESESGEPWLREHGDTQIPPGTVDLAVNVLEGPPAWLADRLAAAAAHPAPPPHPPAPRAGAAPRHGRAPAECLLLNGAAEAFWLLAQVLRPRLAACVHPTFTEGEAALRAAGIPIHRVFREPEHWSLDPAAVPDDADLVLITRPDNPTGALDPVTAIERLCRPGRTVVVDEAFADFLPGGGDLAERGDLPGLVVVRSLTKLWGIAGLRTGYLLADPATAARLDASRQPWPVSSLALDAIEACVAAETERRDRVRLVAERRSVLYDALAALPGVRVWPGTANFLLIRTVHTDLRERLLGDGFALRRGDTFPGLDAHYLRIAVREPSVTDALRDALHRHLKADS
jgi:histidinol-phosphate/aromatic aminotransferase/cobyric acid decarboxylase-like protein